ncbi:MAG: hypothetical protein INR71_11775 [Terriglobus roseus]|nr:hypothetical protein [Terriglobus roseus]
MASRRSQMSTCVAHGQQQQMNRQVRRTFSLLRLQAHDTGPRPFPEKQRYPWPRATLIVGAVQLERRPVTISREGIDGPATPAGAEEARDGSFPAGPSEELLGRRDGEDTEE